MKEILTYGNRKTDMIGWDISTQELKDKAFSELFKILDEEWDIFSYLENAESKVLLNARKGDSKHILKLLNLTQGYEYCDWNTLTLRS